MESIDKICRCCLKEDDNLTEFTCKLEVEGFPSIIELFQYTTVIESSKDAMEFSRICDDCLSDLNTAYNFKRKCEENDTEYQRVLDEFIRCHDIIESDELVEDEIISTEQELENEEIATEKLDDEEIDDIKEELLLDDSIEETENTEDLPQFMIENVKQEIDDMQIIDDFEGESIVTRYIELSEKQKVSQSSLKKFESGGYPCKHCGKRLSNPRQVRIHEKRIHGSKAELQILCDFCDETFDNKHSLKEHMKSHESVIENSYVCDMCPKTFNNKTSLKNHRNHFHDLVPKQFKCEICLKEFKQKCALSKHYKIHADVRPFPCDYCDKRFRLKHHREQHVRTHTGERPFFCEICGANFSQPESLNQHVKAHIAKAEGIEFKCKFCNKNFTRMKILQEHVKTHTDPHRHQCPYCDAKYHHKADLRTHLFSKHLNMTFNCMICNAELKLNERFHRTYSQHVETSHIELSSDELTEFLEKIKKMRIYDVSDELPDILKEKSTRSNECSICEINFSTLNDLRNHNKKFHPSE